LESIANTNPSLGLKRKWIDVEDNSEKDNLQIDQNVEQHVEQHVEQRV